MLYRMIYDMGGLPENFKKYFFMLENGLEPISEYFF